MYVIQVAGYKNSGKTTLVNYGVDYFSKRNYQVATIKHHGHGGEPNYVTNTDSYQHFQYGSTLSTVIGEETLSIIGKNKTLSVEAILALYQQIGIDLVFIEGYKHVNYPKIVLLRDREDVGLIETLPSIIYLFAKQPIQKGLITIPFFTQYDVLFKKIEKELARFNYKNLPLDQKGRL